MTSESRLEESEAGHSSDVKSNEVEDVGASFRYMAEGNMWVLEFAASGIRVLADPWLVDNQTFWDLPLLYSGKVNFHRIFQKISISIRRFMELSSRNSDIVWFRYDCWMSRFSYL